MVYISTMLLEIGVPVANTNAAASGQLVQIPTLHIEVARLHRFRLADTAHVPHFRERGEVFVVVCLVNEDTVNAQLFKRHDIILSGLVIQLIEPLLDRLLCAAPTA